MEIAMVKAVSVGCVALMVMDWVLKMDPEETKYLMEGSSVRNRQIRHSKGHLVTNVSIY